MTEQKVFETVQKVSMTEQKDYETEQKVFITKQKDPAEILKDLAEI